MGGSSSISAINTRLMPKRRLDKEREWSRKRQFLGR